MENQKNPNRTRWWPKARVLRPATSEPHLRSDSSSHPTHFRLAALLLTLPLPFPLALLLLLPLSDSVGEPAFEEAWMELEAEEFGGAGVRGMFMRSKIESPELPCKWNKETWISRSDKGTIFAVK